MRLAPWNKSKEETLGEINRKMQRALEESLMKNIHLQQVRGGAMGLWQLPMVLLMSWHWKYGHPLRTV